MAKNKPRYLRLGLKYNAPGSSKETVRRYLLASIRRGDYAYPHRWRVAIGWSNKPNTELKWGEWTAEMKKSAASSPGWDIAVTNYLENQR